MLRVGTLYFAYGANMDPDNLARRVGIKLDKGWAARLNGWRLAFNKLEADGSLVASLVESEGCYTYGVVYRLPQQALPRLDEYEEAPAHYRRTTLWVEPLGRQARQAALVYLGQPKWTVEEGRPEPGYLQLLVRGATYHGLPADYVEWLGGSLGC